LLVKWSKYVAFIVLLLCTLLVVFSFFESVTLFLDIKSPRANGKSYKVTYCFGSSQVETVAQFGVIFLLFALGLEFSTTKVALYTHLFIHFGLNLYIFSSSIYGVNLTLHVCSFELFEQWLFLEVCCKFSYLCACVE
jgi:hypothetical protein